MDRAAVKAGGAPWNIAKATSEERPNGRSIGRTHDNYYYRHPAIFRAGCKTARGNFVNAIKIAVKKRSENRLVKVGSISPARVAGERAEMRNRAIDRQLLLSMNPPRKREIPPVYDKERERKEREAGPRNSRHSRFVIRTPLIARNFCSKLCLVN